LSIYDDYYTDPEDNPLVDEYEIKREEYEENIAKIQEKQQKRKEKFLEEKFEREMIEESYIREKEKNLNDPEFWEELYQKTCSYYDEPEDYNGINDNSEDIKRFVEKKGINKLVHFTSYYNLESILKNGLLPVSDLKNKKIDYYNNDSDRYDGFIDAVSVSITFPNYRTFYKKRKEYKKRNWVVLILDKSILWDKDCLFVDGNAATYKNSNNLKENKEQLLNSLNSLKNLFEDIKEYRGDKKQRQNNLISENMPTNPQSEVLIFNRIEVKYIKEIHYKGFNMPDDIINNNPEIKFYGKTPHYYFNYRDDYEYWRKNNG
jgi:hypothetical protein